MDPLLPVRHCLAISTSVCVSAAWSLCPPSLWAPNALFLGPYMDLMPGCLSACFLVPFSSFCLLTPPRTQAPTWCPVPGVPAEGAQSLGERKVRAKQRCGGGCSLQNLGDEEKGGFSRNTEAAPGIPIYLERAQYPAPKLSTLAFSSTHTPIDVPL